MGGQILNRLQFTPFNMVCTNVPGPQCPLYLLGHKMLHCYPYVPIGGEMALNCAILTYNGTAYFGFSGDVHAAPDLRRLETLLQLSFKELRDAAGGKPARKVQRKKQKRVRVEAKNASSSMPATASVSASEPVTITLGPPASVESAESPASPDTEKKVLAELIA
jgi:diacylglycerol O-acyltransferase / wax synthase